MFVWTYCDLQRELREFEKRDMNFEKLCTDVEKDTEESNE